MKPAPFAYRRPETVEEAVRLLADLLVNERTYPLRLEPCRTLRDAIRDECRLTDTHMCCEHGVCGACTVLVDGDPSALA